jgi:cell wall-associated NlpC family hydrolase
MDCSGAIYHLFQSLGHTDIPRQSDQIAQWLAEKTSLTSVTNAQSLQDPAFAALQPGDLLFWTTPDAPKDRKLPVTHVMLYLGIHQTTGKPLLFGSSDGRTYAGQRRIGVSVFDLNLPKPSSPSTLHSYGRPPPAPGKPGSRPKP